MYKIEELHKMRLKDLKKILTAHCGAERAEMLNSIGAPIQRQNEIMESLGKAQFAWPNAAVMSDQQILAESSARAEKLFAAIVEPLTK